MHGLPRLIFVGLALVGWAIPVMGQTPGDTEGQGWEWKFPTGSNIKRTGNEVTITSPQTGQSIGLNEKILFTDDCGNTCVFQPRSAVSNKTGTSLVHDSIKQYGWAVVMQFTPNGQCACTSWGYIQLVKTKFEAKKPGEHTFKSYQTLNPTGGKAERVTKDWDVDHLPADVWASLPENFKSRLQPYPCFPFSEKVGANYLYVDLPGINNPWRDPRFGANGTVIRLTWDFKTWILCKKPKDKIKVLGFLSWRLVVTLTISRAGGSLASGTRYSTNKPTFTGLPAPGTTKFNALSEADRAKSRECYELLRKLLKRRNKQHFAPPK